MITSLLFLYQFQILSLLWIRLPFLLRTSSRKVSQNKLERCQARYISNDCAHHRERALLGLFLTLPSHFFPSFTSPDASCAFSASFLAEISRCARCPPSFSSDSAQSSEFVIQVWVSDFFADNTSLAHSCRRPWDSTSLDRIAVRSRNGGPRTPRQAFPSRGEAGRSEMIWMRPKFVFSMVWCDSM